MNRVTFLKYDTNALNPIFPITDFSRIKLRDVQCEIKFRLRFSMHSSLGPLSDQTRTGRFCQDAVFLKLEHIFMNVAAWWMKGGHGSRRVWPTFPEKLPTKANCCQLFGKCVSRIVFCPSLSRCCGR